jgi:hypothetical protein
MVKELVMSKFGTMGLLAAAVFSTLVSVSAASGSGTTPEEMIREFKNADRNGDGQISLDEYKLSRELIVGLTGAVEEEKRANLPVYINGYERHFPRNKIYFLTSGGVILYDQGPDRFFK